MPNKNSTIKPYFDKVENNGTLYHHKLREEIKQNIRNLLDKINCNIDLKRWTNLDSKVTFNKFYKINYSPIT